MAVADAAHELPPDALWQRIEAACSRAEAQGVAYKTDTLVRLLHDPQDPRLCFVLRVAAALRDKPKPPKPGGPGGPPPRNPFLPYDEALWVAHLSASHTLLLNKFNVVRHHLLVVTRAFEPQAAPLTAGDLGATWRVMQAMPGGGLAYFNCGEHSGASQPHKHTQVVPLPLATPAELTRGAEASASAPGPSSGPPVEDRPAGLGPEASGVSAPAAAGPEGSRSSPPAAPAAPGLRRAGSGGAGEAGVCGGEAAAAGGGAAGEGVPPLLDVLADEALRAAGAAAWEARPLRSLPFQCFCAALPAREDNVRGEALAGAFRALHASAFPRGDSEGPPSFNVLLTRRHMALVPRSREAWGPVSVNAMGYAGSLLVRSREELEHIEAEGPLCILAAVGVPW